MIFSYTGSCYKRGKSEEMRSLIRMVKAALKGNIPLCIEGWLVMWEGKDSWNFCLSDKQAQYVLGKPFGPLHPLCACIG